MASSAQQDKSNLIVPVVIVAALVPIIGGVIWYLDRNPAEPAQKALLTAEAKDYTKFLNPSEVQMKATANYVGATVVEIVGKITNTGHRPVSVAELTCVFTDAYGQTVLRERVPIIRRRLNPGETRDFRLPFEGIPDSWNQALPQLVIANIGFAE